MSGRAARAAPLTALTVAAALAAATPAAARSDHYLGLILGSVHIGTGALNNFNPGLTWGTRWAPRPGHKAARFVEGGVFYNSYREVSPIFMAGLAWPLGRVGRVEWRGGAALGTAYYPTLARDLKARYGIPSLGGFIPMVALSLTAQIGRNEWRLTTVPAGGDVRAIINLSLARHF